MKIRDIGEFELIKKISHNSITNSRNILVSIGDDAAVFSIDPGKVITLTTDLLIEDVHFIRTKITPVDLGYKAIAVNLSDIAAMGAKPEHVFVSLGIPDDLDVEYIDNLYTGMKEMAGKYDVNILGGDTSISKMSLFINIAMTGIADPDRLLYRNIARPDDIVFSTGYLGSSRAGLQLLMNYDKSEEDEFSELINAHKRPYPFVEEGLFLSECTGVHAAIDVSDGLSSDLGHIAEQSDTGFCLEEKKMPVSDALKNFCMKYSYEPVEYALAGGEDYVLVFTADPECAADIAESYRNKFSRKLYRIGKITSSKERLLLRENGSLVKVSNKGWNHFKSV